ncbi:hypothetical protein B0T24DRAFT_599792 [Lasiosphaeria ovina]|uniref:HNH nuclease domain-containing protein n=1 Tax=Lasiosphaeria ovina TaxID=92902 RepID=A0AAE0MXW9_9PEZI|nr:hypothetical protein B0T24DRAFT_599792 [Lasiosphaeria ovina]
MFRLSLGISTALLLEDDAEVQNVKYFTSRVGVSDKLWNMISLSPHLHVWWRRAYFGFKFLGILPSEEEDKSMIRVQFHWMPKSSPRFTHMPDLMNPEGFIRQASKGLVATRPSSAHPQAQGAQAAAGSSPRVGDDVREWFRPSTRRPSENRTVPVVVDGREATLERQPAKAQAYRLRRAGASAPPSPPPPPPRSIDPRVVNSRGRPVDGTRRPDTPVESVEDGFRLPSVPSSPIGEMALAIRSPGPSQARSQAPAFSSPALPPASPAIGAPPILRAESTMKSPSPKEVIPKLGRPRIESPSPFDIQNYEGDWPDEMFTQSWEPDTDNNAFVDP